MKNWLTHSLGGSPPILCGELSGLADFRNSTCITRPGCLQGEVPWNFDRLVSSSCHPHTDLEGGGVVSWVLSPRVDDPSFAAISYLHVVWSPWQQINYSWVPLAAVGNVPFEFRAISLLCSLRPYHGPYHLLLRPFPTQAPPRSLDMAVLLEIEHCHNGLRR